MIRTVLLPLLAIVGIVYAMFSVMRATRPAPVALPVVEPASPPFQSFVAGAGVVEPRTQNIDIGVPVGGLVVEVPVTVGDSLTTGDVLFRIDDRDLRAELATREADVRSARSDLARLRAMPRAEELPPARARVEESRATLADVTAQLRLWESVIDKRAISEDELTRRRFAVNVAAARVAEAESNLALLESGAWAPEIDQKTAAVDVALARLEALRVEIERRVIRAPLDGRVLQSNVRAGEFAPAGIASPPLMVVGAVNPMHLRVDVDENDAWRVAEGAAAVAFLRGNTRFGATLAFVRFEPLVVPKRSLTGDSVERVDTRVLQVIYEIQKPDVHLFVGQLMDVFIEAPSLSADPQKERTP